MPTTSRRSSAYSRRRFTRSTRRGSAKTSRPTRTPPRSLYGIPVGHVKSSGSSRGGRLQLSARSGLPAYSGGDEIFVCSRAASGRVCRRIAKLSLCPRCRWFVIPSEVDETECDEQCPVDRRQPSTGEVCRVAGRGALGFQELPQPGPRPAEGELANHLVDEPAAIPPLRHAVEQFHRRPR